MKQDCSPKAYSFEEIAIMLKISPRKAADFCENEASIIVKQIGKRCKRVTKTSFDRWFDNNS